jgi:3alpha(or 20beta)-hydroxysteroid dehydrogenase
VRVEESWPTYVNAALERFGRVNVLVNNAGIVNVAPMVETSLEDYMDVVQTNQVGCFMGMKAVVPAMQAIGGGSIINIASVNGLQATAYLVGYCASKFAVHGMTQTAAQEFGPLNIRVNAIDPGGIDTAMGGVDAEGFEHIDANAYYASIPASRIGQPAEVASLGVFLASDESSFMHGASFTVDGGITAGIRY